MSKPKFVAAGGFGCVYYPSLPCVEKHIDTEGKICKLMLAQNAATEMKQYKTISKVDPDGEYYLGVPDVGTPDLSDASVLEELRKCKLFGADAKLTDFKKKRLLIQKNGGIDLMRFGNLVKSWTPSADNTHRLEQFFLAALHLFKGVAMFESKGALHMDLKPENIVYDEPSKKLNFIDFGMFSIIRKKPSWSGTNFNIPPELWLYGYLPTYTTGKGETMRNAVSIAAQFTEFKKKLDVFVANPPKTIAGMRSGTFLYEHTLAMLSHQYKCEILEFSQEKRQTEFQKYIRFMQSITADAKQLEQVFNTHIIHKSDTYGLGVALYFVLVSSKRLLNARLFAELEAVFERMCDVDVFSRYDPLGALFAYETALRNTGLLENHKDAAPLPKEFVLPKPLEAKRAETETNTDVHHVLPIEIALNPCPEGKELSAKTKKCVKVCEPGKTRNVETGRCVAAKKSPKTKKKRSPKKKNS